MKKRDYSMRVRNKKITFGRIIKYLVFATNIIMIGLLLSSFLAWKISPLKTNIFSYIGLGFGVILLINILYLILWIVTKKWWLAIFSLASLLICTKPITTFFPLNISKKEIPEKSIKILTYNVKAFENESKRDCEKRPLLNYIADTDADIVCLQEYFVSKTGQSFITQKDINRILNKYPYRYVSPLDFSNEYYFWGLAIFSKYPIENKRDIIFEKSYNGAAIYTLNIEGEKYTIANVHLESNQITSEDKQLYSQYIQSDNEVKLEDVTTNIRKRLGRGFRKRAAQTNLIKRAIAKTDSDNIIICGDFNDTPISYAYNNLKTGLSDAYVSNCFGTGITYHEDFFLFRIDYIFHSKNLKATQTRVDKVKYSDHYPLITYISTKKQKKN